MVKTSLFKECNVTGKKHLRLGPQGFLPFAKGLFYINTQQPMQQYDTDNDTQNPNK